VSEVPPLDGDKAKNRPVVVVSPPVVLKSGGAFVVVACSTTVLESDKTRIELPNRGDHPQTRTGLTKKTWVVPRWYLAIERERLGDYIGHIGGELLRRVVVSVQECILDDAKRQ
jgi:mRNA-degrading endonuclease toxin of MazEF toxin-antitoxin module